MKSISRIVRPAVLTVGVALSVFALVGCSTQTPTPGATASAAGLTVGPDTSTASVTIKESKAAHDLLPADIQKAGKIVVGLEANAGYPNSLTTPKGTFGLTPDLARALGKALGIGIDIQSVPFPTLIPGMQAKRYDMSTSLYFDTAERRKVLDFVDIQLAANNLFILGPATQRQDMTYATACGAKVGIIAGGSYVQKIQAASDACVAAGKPAIQVSQYSSSPEALVAVQSGRVEAMVTSSAQALYMVKSDPKRLRIGSNDNQVVGYEAIAFPKGSDLVPAVREAALSINDSGVWKKILAEYGSESSVPSDAVIKNTTPWVPGSPS